MTVYVDDPRFERRGRLGYWSHMMTDGDLRELHDLAEKISLKRAWFQSHRIHPHYDLTPGKRLLAIQFGAVPVSSSEMVRRCSKLFRGDRTDEHNATNS